MSKKINIINRKASYEYEFISKYIAGIALFGTEIKSIRNNNANISNAYCIVEKNEVYIRNLHIGEYSQQGYISHDLKRDRKLLLNRNEINKIALKLMTKGNALVPIKLFIDNKNRAKLEIALAKGKKIYDKRENIKAKDQKREQDRIIKNKFN